MLACKNCSFPSSRTGRCIFRVVLPISILHSYLGKADYEFQKKKKKAVQNLLAWLDSELYVSDNIDLYISKCAVSFPPWLRSYLLSAFGFLHLIQLRRDCLQHSKLLSSFLTAAIEIRTKTKLFSVLLPGVVWVKIDPFFFACANCIPAAQLLVLELPPLLHSCSPMRRT